MADLFFTPAFLPISILIDRHFNVKIVGNAYIVTPLGVFGFKTANLIRKSEKPMLLNGEYIGKDDLIVGIRYYAGEWKERILKVHQGKQLSICTDGKTIIHAQNGLVLIDVSNGDINHIRFSNLVSESSKNRNGSGLFYLNSGNRKKYEGEYMGKDIPHGCGKMEYSDGSVYEGHFINGTTYGAGTLQMFDGTIITGRFKSGCKCLEGKLIKNNGDKYKGPFRNNIPHGKGKYKYRNGDKYSGEFLDGQKEGKGKMKWVSGAYFEGEFLKNRYWSGYGKFYLSKGVYRGRIEKRQANGYGEMSYHDGNVYSGNFRSGIRHGQGRFSYKNGDFCEGEFKSGLLHGEAHCRYGELMFYCFFQDGLLNGKCSILYPDDTREEGYYKDGEKEGIWRFYEPGRRSQSRSDYYKNGKIK